MVHKLFLSSERALVSRLRRGGAKFPPEVPRLNWINGTLKSPGQVEEALAEVRRCGLPRHPDAPKNWDFLSAIKTVLQRTSPDAKILDVGSTVNSAALPWLYLYGYRDLWGIDLDHTMTLRKGPITYQHGDATATRFQDQSFDAALCLSVIEHGVDTRAFWREMARILRPSGLLVTSTDYWSEPIDTRGQTAFGAPIRVFSRPDVQQMIADAQSCGFATDGAIDLECDQKTVHWGRFDLRYTFLCFALTKTEKA